MHLGCIATPGGSGAICNTFSNYLDCGQKVLLPSLMWTNYIQMANEAHLGYETYELFDEMVALICVILNTRFSF